MNDILTSFTQQERRDWINPAWERYTFPTHARLVSHAYQEGFVLYSELDSQTAESVIAGEVAYFKGVGYSFEWKYYDYDRPTDLKERLIQHGFEVAEAEALLILDLAHLPARLMQPTPHELRRITDPDLIASQVMALQAEVWGEDMSAMVTFLRDELTQQPDHLSIYVAYMDGQPVSSAWLRYPHAQAGEFGSLWGGSTLPAYRGRGIYSALLAVRAQEALARGLRYLYVDASPMSRPILEKLGFGFYGYSYPCQWQP
jgi:predicted GNAT family acetyltransferase